jgi:hypothetical protein
MHFLESRLENEVSEECDEAIALLLRVKTYANAKESPTAEEIRVWKGLVKLCVTSKERAEILIKYRPDATISKKLAKMSALLNDVWELISNEEFFRFMYDLKSGIESDVKMSARFAGTEIEENISDFEVGKRSKNFAPDLIKGHDEAIDFLNSLKAQLGKPYYDLHLPCEIMNVSSFERYCSIVKLLINKMKIESMLSRSIQCNELQEVLDEVYPLVIEDIARREREEAEAEFREEAYQKKKSSLKRRERGAVSDKAEG